MPCRAVADVALLPTVAAGRMELRPGEELPGGSGCWGDSRLSLGLGKRRSQEISALVALGGSAERP